MLRVSLASHLKFMVRGMHTKGTNGTKGKCNRLVDASNQLLVYN